MRLRDKDVRAAIYRSLVPTLIANSPSRVLDEFSLCKGESRIDVAVVNGKIHGVEIKSEADTLERLSRQVELYSRVFDTVTIVCGQNHLPIVQERVPHWWGIYCAITDELEQVRLVQIRLEATNDDVDPFSLAQLLWKQEILDLLDAAGQAKGASRKTCCTLWSILAAAYPLEALQREVRQILRTRRDWRPDPLQK